MQRAHSVLPGLCAAAVVAALQSAPAGAQMGPPQPPAVGVVKVVRKPVTQASEYVGRIQGTQRVNIVARVSAFLEKRSFVEGTEVKSGDLLYRLEQQTFQADVQAKEAAVAQVQAQLVNANATLSRAQALLRTNAGPQSAVDAALANQQSLQAQLLAAQAQLRQSQINLGYTEIRAPIDGKIGRTTVTEGNWVGPGAAGMPNLGPAAGVLTTIVSQDPMYVVCAVSARAVLEMRQRHIDSGNNWIRDLVIKVRLPDGRMYDRTGKVDFADNTIAQNTDTIIIRAVIPNPVRKSPSAAGAPTSRELVDGELVTVVVEEAQAQEALTIPRAAVLSDQAGDFVYVVDADNKAQQRRIKLGQSTPTTAVVVSGLSEGEDVIVDGIQRVRAGQPVAPAPAASSSVDEARATPPRT